VQPPLLALLLQLLICLLPLPPLLLPACLLLPLPPVLLLLAALQRAELPQQWALQQQ